MRADSLLQGVRRVDEQGERLLSVRTFSGSEPALWVDTAMAALVDLAELLRAGAPFPPRLETEIETETSDRAGRDCLPDGGSGRTATGSGESPADRDDLVRLVLETGYERGSTPIGDLSPAVADRVAAADRLETVDSRVIVPLSATAPYARNWRPLIETLLERLEGVREDFERIVRRVQAGDVDGPLATGCEAIARMLETLSLVVRRADADTRYVRDRADHRQDELLSTIEDATTQLRSDDNA
ncbi:hypothetical protein [Natrinema versiforme]|uniref:Uncharacterized protein n=1 Tax=Natrinema versiforme JCM 10478 TaxID=1227496 RepID=L9XVW0_9EURY|nr:hypothetical protein [Natrinema versiforme]ELY65905.1 hypothetical protein C489_13628 [Natrinema versiforme JCM 10478]